MSASATPPDSAAQVHPGLSNAQLGHILARALEEVDQLKAERDAAVTRATRAESLTSNSPSVNVDPVQANSETIASLQALNEQQQRTISELTGRLKAVTDAYTAFERAYGSYDAKVHDARQNLARAIRPQHNASSAHSSPQLPHSDTSSGFQPIPSRKSSRTATLPPPPSPASQYHQHHSHHQHQHQQGAHLHPSLQIPPGAPGGRSTVSAGVPANLPPVPIAGRVRLREDSIPRRQSDESPAPRHRLSADDAADLAAVDDGERRAKRFRSEAHAAPPRRDRARFTESPRSAAVGISPQFTFPPPGSTGSGYAYPHALQIDRFPNPVPSPSSAASSRRQFSDGTTGTLHSAITPTSAATTASRSSINSRHYAPTSARMDSLEEEAPSIMTGGQRMESPRPMPRKDEGGERRSRDDDDNILVDKLINDAIETDGPQPPTSATGEGEMERDELEPDVMLSPRSSMPHIHHHRRDSDTDKWKERDRLRELERQAHGQPQDYNKRSPTSATVDRFRHYSIPPAHTSPGPHPYAHPPERDRPPRTGSPPHQHMHPPMTATFAINQQGQLQATGRRGTIAGLVPPQRSHTDGERERSSFSAFESSHRRTYSGGGSGDFTTGGSSGKGSPVINFFANPPRHTGPGPAVKPTLNAQGQRTCRQCHQPGRYKDGKCVEKWGPGPAGPGTVCDRCRKKMKRVERRGTQEAASLAQGVVALNQMHHQSQPQSPQQSPSQQYYNNPAYRPSSATYSPSDPQREYQFQPPLSASSNNWSAGGRRDSSQLGSAQSQHYPQDRDRGRPEHRSQKRRAPEYSESPSPPPSSRKGSGSVEEEMERAAEHLMAEVEHPRTSAKDKTSADADDDREPDAEGDDAEGEDAVDEDVEDPVVGSVVPPPSQPSPPPLPILAKPEHPPPPSHPVSPPQSASADAKPPSWTKLEENGVLVSTH